MADSTWYTGNAADETDQHRGWLLGHFISPHNAVRTTESVEVKWGVHPAGQQRPGGWTVGEARSTMVILVSGIFRIDLTEGGVVLLQRQGDYVVWGPGIDHTWQAEADSVVITVRWPSIPE